MCDGPGVSRIEQLCHRIYSDFLLPDRLDEYRTLIEQAREHGYDLHSLASYRSGRNSNLSTDSRVLLIRHDIDTDPATVGMQFAIERALDARASYFFRLSTIDVSLMHEIAATGSDVGYHFEEIATFAKEHRLRTRAQVEARLDEVREAFRDNLISLRHRTGLPITMVAAHGDMANRHLRMSNVELLTPALRAELGIDAEAHDRDLYAASTSRFSDDAHPRFWKPYDVRIALERRDPMVYMLTHPRHWRHNTTVNLRANLERAIEGVRYRRRRRDAA